MPSVSVAEVATVIGLLVIANLALDYRNKKRFPLPPGPPTLPFVGNLHQLSKFPWQSFTEWSRQYGDVITVRAGAKLWIVLNSKQAIKDLIIDRGLKYSSRPTDSPVRAIVSRNGMGLIFAVGDSTWKDNRKISHKALSKSAVQSYRPFVDHESRILIQNLLAGSPDGFDPHKLCSRWSLNVILTACYGHRATTPDDSYATRLVESLRSFNDLILMTRSPLDFFPFLKLFPISDTYTQAAIKTRDLFEGVMQDIIDDLRKKIADGTDAPCFVGTLLKDNMKEQIMSEHELLHVCGDLTLAGIDTSSMSLNWFIGLLAYHPEVQQRCWDELDRVVGRKRVPSIEDYEHFEYISCVIKELLRLYSPVVFGIPHVVTEDDVYRGWFIPKDTVIFTNWYGIHRDPNNYEDPEVFRPERHLSYAKITVSDQSRGKFSERQQFPFGAGRRICPGMDLADTELQTAVAMLLWATRVELVRDENGELVDPPNLKDGLFQWPLFNPKPFKIRILPRFEGVERIIAGGISGSA